MYVGENIDMHKYYFVYANICYMSERSNVHMAILWTHAPYQ